jgi:minor histocompatibility antigen H13
VAKNFDAPIKLLFPKTFAQADSDASFSMLGLGDIVLPGFFVSLLLRYDANRAGIEVGKVDHSASIFPKTVFHVTMLGYTLGLCATVFVMYLFQHAQPALLYLVPGCLAFSLLGGVVSGTLQSLIAYEEKSPEDDDQRGEDVTPKPWYESMLNEVMVILGMRKKTAAAATAAAGGGGGGGGGVGGEKKKA